MKVISATDLASFAAAVTPWLAADPVRNNVIATVMSARLTGLVPPEDGIMLLRIVGDDAALAGVAIQTPPQAMLLPGLSPAATAALIGYLHQHAPDVSAFNGPTDVAQQVASAVATRTGADVKVSRGLGRFTLDTVVVPAAPAGAPRLANRSDIALIKGWIHGFHHDIGSETEPESCHLGRSVSENLLWLWDTSDGPVAMTGLTLPAHGVVRLKLVYTPPLHRRHGFASALVAHLAQQILDHRHIPMLFTDLANGTSNRIYQAIGFRKLDEAAHWQVVQRAGQLTQPLLGRRP